MVKVIISWKSCYKNQLFLILLNYFYHSMLFSYYHKYLISFAMVKNNFFCYKSS